MSGPWRQYLRRSIETAQDTMGKAIRMEMIASRAPTKLLSFTSPEDLKQYATGCDADIGGFSTCHLDMGEDGKAKFWGKLSTKVPTGLEGQMKSGYAVFRSKIRSTFFGEQYFDTAFHHFLHLRVRAGGDRRTWDTYFVNLQTETPVTSDIWQHRLFLRGEGEWEDVLIPFRSFILTNYGRPVEDPPVMNREKVRTIGISILGGKFGVDGEYELALESINLVNEAPGDPPRYKPMVL